jgi:RNA polymerase sigma factor (sigma-70 family)
MDDLTALKELKENPKSNSRELSDWFDRTFKYIVRKITFKFGFELMVAEEIAAEVIFKATMNIENIKNEAALKKWLDSITINASKDQYRKLTIKDEKIESDIIKKKAVVRSVTVKNGIKTTIYDCVENDEKGSRRLKFGVFLSKSDDQNELATTDDLLDAYTSDFSLYGSNPEDYLSRNEFWDCVDNSISRFKESDEEKAKAIKLMILGTSNEEIALTLNRNPKGIREYMSQTYKKFKVFVAPCVENYKLS